MDTQTAQSDPSSAGGDSSPPSMLDAALGYAGRGWPVFPIRQGGKTPLTVRGFKDASTDPATIRAWWQRWPGANVGIPTGEVSGVAVVDVDPRHGGDVSVESLIARHGELPQTPESLTGGGGRHLLFKYRPGFRNSANNLAAGIDTRGEGGYIVAPPSLHPDGPRYEWEASSHPDDVELAELPDWLFPGDQPKLPKPDGAGNLNFDAGTVAVKADGAPVAPGGRNNALASLAGQWIHEGKSVAEALRQAKAWNATNPVPLPDNEVERTVGSVVKTHLNNNPAGAVAVVPVPVAVVEVVEDVPDAEPARTSLRGPKPFPADLLQPPGFVGEIVNWINATAYMPQPVLALGNAFAFFGAVIGRKVATPSDARTNLYCLGVGESGCGKDHSRKCVKRIADAAGLTDQLLGGEDISSDSAILGAVYEKPSILFQFDEIGHLIANTSSKYAQSHQRAIAPLLTKLFSSSNTKMLGKEFANRKENRRRDIDQPNVCIYGTTVPGRLYEGLTPEEIRDGFLGRMLVFQSHDPDPLEQDVVIGPVPESLTIMVQTWFQRTDLPKAEGNVASARDHLPMIVPLEPDARAEFDRFRVRCKELKASTRGLNGLDALWARALEHASKLALVIACGCEYGAPVISGDVAAYAVKLVDHLITQLIESVEDSVAGSQFEKEYLYVLRAIKAGRGKGVSTNDLIQRTRRLAPRERSEILNQLVGSTEVFKRERKSSRGPAAMVYVHKNYCC